MLLTESVACTSIAILIQAEVFYRHVLEPKNITVASHMFETLDDPVVDVTDLFVSFLLAVHTSIAPTNTMIPQFQEDDYRVIFLNCYPQPARKILCEVS